MLRSAKCKADFEICKKWVNKCTGSTKKTCTVSKLIIARIMKQSIIRMNAMCSVITARLRRNEKRCAFGNVSYRK